MLSVLALDPATKTGWAVRDGAGRRKSGCQSFALKRGQSYGTRFLMFNHWLRGLLHEHKIEVLVYERAGGFFRSASAGEVAHGFQSLILTTAEDEGVETLPVPPGTLKKHATGKGNAPKGAMLEAAKRKLRGLVPPGAGPDEIDALWVLDWGLKEIDPDNTERKAMGHGLILRVKRIVRGVLRVRRIV